MNRITSDNTFEMDMHQLALNQVYIGKDGWAWYRNAPEDELSVCDLIRTAAETLGVDLPMLSDAGLSGVLTYWLQYGVDEPEGVLAILYRALYAMAEVRAKLSRYEDTGLEPEEITTEPYGCVFYCNRKCNLDGDFCAEGPGCPYEINAEIAKHLLELAQAEKDGRMVVLPVPVGTDKVAYGLTDPDDGPQRIETIECGYLEKLEIWDNPGHEVVVEVDGWEIGESDIGKTVFLTREEAEAALKKREEADNETD